MDSFDEYLERVIFPLLKPIDKKRKQKLFVFLSIIAIVLIANIMIVEQFYIDFYLIFVLFLSIIVCVVAYKQVFKSYKLGFC